MKKELFSLWVAWLFLLAVFSPFPRRAVSSFELSFDIAVTILLVVMASQFLSFYIIANIGKEESE